MTRTTLYRLLFLVLTFSLLPVQADAQRKRKARKSRTTKTTKKASKKSSASRSAKTTYFQGALLYRTYEYHSAIVRKTSHGRAYNGERTMKVIMKGADIHVIDESMHLHTIILPNSNTGYIYSDVA